MIRVALKEARGYMPLSVLADLTGFSRQHLFDIESGKKKPSLDAIDKICDALNCEIGDLLKREI